MADAVLARSHAPFSTLFAVTTADWQWKRWLLMRMRSLRPADPHWRPSPHHDHDLLRHRPRPGLGKAGSGARPVYRGVSAIMTDQLVYSILFIICDCKHAWAGLCGSALRRH